MSDEKQAINLEYERALLRILQAMQKEYNAEAINSKTYEHIALGVVTQTAIWFTRPVDEWVFMQDKSEFAYVITGFHHKTVRIAVSAFNPTWAFTEAYQQWIEIVSKDNE